MEQERILGKDHPISNLIFAEEELDLQEFPPMKLPNLSGYAIRCWGYGGSIISHPNLANPTSSCIHPSTHNREKLRKPSTSTFEKHSLYKLWRYSRTPAPVLGGVEVISPTNCIKEIFDVGVLNSGIPELQR